MRIRHSVLLAAPLLLCMLAPSHAQEERPIGVPVPPLGDGPWVIDTAEQHKIRVSVVARGLSHPWAIAFLPDGDMLVTERPGRLRIVRGGVLDPHPISGVPQVRTDGNGGLLDVALHPRFANNDLVYLTYTKADGNGRGSPALARGRLEAGALVDVEDLVVTDAYEGNSGLNGRVAFGHDGKVFMSTGGNVGNVAQDPASLRGKMLRLNDDGSVPPDNPFVDQPGYRPEIYALGHRNSLGLIVHPETGLLWNHENGPNGGDEINIILPGRNYGWPVVSFGRNYPGSRVSEHPTREGMESPLVVWLPAIAVAGMAVYTGDQFPAWRGNVLVGSLREGGIPGTGHLQRIVFNDSTEELRRESMLTELRQRIREVREGARRIPLPADGRGRRGAPAHRAGSVSPRTASSAPAPFPAARTPRRLSLLHAKRLCDVRFASGLAQVRGQQFSHPCKQLLGRTETVPETRLGNRWRRQRLGGLGVVGWILIAPDLAGQGGETGMRELPRATYRGASREPPDLRDSSIDGLRAPIERRDPSPSRRWRGHRPKRIGAGRVARRLQPTGSLTKKSHTPHTPNWHANSALPVSRGPVVLRIMWRTSPLSPAPMGDFVEFATYSRSQHKAPGSPVESCGSHTGARSRPADGSSGVLALGSHPCASRPVRRRAC